MLTTNGILLAAQVATLTALTWSQADEKNEKMNKLERLRELLVSVDRPTDIGKQCAAEFEPLSAVQLLALESDKSPSISLFAGWESFRKALPSEKLKELNTFLSIMENRLGFKIPSIAKSVPQQNIVQNAPEILMDHLITGAGTSLETPDTLPMTKKAGLVTIARGPKAMTMSEEALNRVLKNYKFLEPCSFNASLGADQSYVIAYDRYGGRFPILCVDTKKSTLVWKSTLWNVGELPAFAGQLMPRAKMLVVSEKTVTVFGLGPYSELHVERFEASSGACLLRYASNFWRRD